MKMVSVGLVCAAVFGFGVVVSGQEVATSIPDSLLAEAIIRLDDSVSRNDQSTIATHAYLVLRAANRFETIYGNRQLRKVERQVLASLGHAEIVAIEATAKRKIRGYIQSLQDAEQP